MNDEGRRAFVRGGLAMLALVSVLLLAMDVIGVKP